jgi:hypothetical protein
MLHSVCTSTLSIWNVLLFTQMIRTLLRPTTTLKPYRTFTSTAIKMGVTIDKISPGDGKNFPQKGDTVSIHCTFPTYLSYLYIRADG